MRRLLDEGKAISPTYVKVQRSRMERYIFSDPICAMNIHFIRRADILDFRSRLRNRTGTRTVNRTVGVLRIVFKEAYFREEINRDPTVGIGEVKYDRQKRGLLTAEEIKALFAECPGVWGDSRGYAAFSLAAYVGMRRGEILEFTWGQINFGGLGILVDKARTTTCYRKTTRYAKRRLHTAASMRFA